MRQQKIDYLILTKQGELVECSANDRSEVLELLMQSEELCRIYYGDSDGSIKYIQDFDSDYRFGEIIEDVENPPADRFLPH